MKKVLFAVLVIIIVLVWVYRATQSSAPANTPKPKSDWVESSSVGDMTQERSYFAVSNKTEPTRKMSFPYNRVTASMGFGCDKSDEWMYIAFSEPPNIANVETEDELNLLVSVIRFDNDIDDYVMTQKFGARFLHFRNDDLVSARVTESSSMIFEVDWYREGTIRFDFSLAGSSEAIEGARNKCARH